MKNLISFKRSFLSNFFQIIICAFFSLNLLGQGVPQCITPLQDGDKVLFIGNSFTDWNGPLPSEIQAIIKASGSNLNVTFTLMTKGCGILKEYATWSSLGMMAEIQKGGWKYVVIQGWRDAIDYKDSPVSESGVTNTDYLGWPQCQDTMLKYLKIIDAEVRKVGATTILYEPHVGHSVFITEMSKSHNTYAKLRSAVSCFYAPVVDAWDSLRIRYPSADSSCLNYTLGSYADLFYHDCGHQNSNGMAMDAMIFYAFFTRRSASTLKPIFPQLMSRPDLYEELAGIAYNTGKKILAMNICSITDTQAPTVPSNLQTSNLLSDSYNLTWTASTDNVGVLGYRVYKDNLLLGTTSTPKFAVGGLSASTTYAMKVLAFDSEGNKSAYSTVLNVTTSANTSVDTSGVLMSWDLQGQGGNASAATNKLMVGISASAPSAIVAVGPAFTPIKFTSPYDYLSMCNNLNKLTLEDAIIGNQYITFSIKPQDGNTISISSIQLRAFSQNYRLRNFTLMSSVKGFILGNEIQTITSIVQSGTLLQTINITGHDNISAAVEFRIYIWGTNNTTEAFGIGNGDAGTTKDDLIISGSVKSNALPSFPTNLTATDLTETGFKLNWKAAKNAVSYEVFKNGVSVGTTTTLSMNITGVTINSTYSMTVKATDGMGTVSEASIPLDVKIPDLGLPSVPQNLSVTSITSNSFTLHWNACTDNVGVTLYEIYMNGKEYGNTQESYLPAPFLIPNTSYSVTVRSKDAAGNVSAFSTALDVKTLAAADVQAPTAPSKLTSPAKTSTTVSLSWTKSTDNTGVAHYFIYRDGVKIDSTISTSYMASGLNSNTAYSFTVKAGDAAGNLSAASNALNIKTSASISLDDSGNILTIYPNPVISVLNVMNIAKQSTLLIFNMNGSLLIQENATSEQMEVNVSNLPAGLYIIKISNQGNSITKKFIKE